MKNQKMNLRPIFWGNDAYLVCLVFGILGKDFSEMWYDGRDYV